MEKVLIRAMAYKDWETIAKIYQQGIQTGWATFENEIPSYSHWDKSHLPFGRWVGEIEKSIVGWVALSQVSSRWVYRGVAELSIYIEQGSRGKGIGSLLLQSLIEDSEKHGIWTLQAGIFPENKASIALHLKMGFRLVGIRQNIGQMKNGTWRNIHVFERRSTKIGVGFI